MPHIVSSLSILTHSLYPADDCMSDFNVSYITCLRATHHFRLWRIRLDRSLLFTVSRPIARPSDKPPSDRPASKALRRRQQQQLTSRSIPNHIDYQIDDAPLDIGCNVNRRRERLASCHLPTDADNGSVRSRKRSNSADNVSVTPSF